MITDWTDAYENGKYIESAAAFPPQWAAASQAFRADLGASAKLDVSYSSAHRQVFDLLMPKGTPVGLAVFVHGGYWRAFDKNSWTHLGQGALERGWAVCIPSYTLAPDARISAMTAEIAAAIDCAAQDVSGPIHLAGHSAGGHLVSRMACSDVKLNAADRLEKVVSISGLHDLRPLLKTEMNAVLHLNQTEAVAESAALQTPRRNMRVTTWVGADERPEFLRQNDLLANIWSGLGADMSAYHDPGKHHFNVIAGLQDPDAAITREFVG